MVSSSSSQQSTTHVSTFGTVSKNGEAEAPVRGSVDHNQGESGQQVHRNGTDPQRGESMKGAPEHEEGSEMGFIALRQQEAGSDRYLW